MLLFLLVTQQKTGRDVLASINVANNIRGIFTFFPISSSAATPMQSK
jgi:hypothetical protein